MVVEPFAICCNNFFTYLFTSAFFIYSNINPAKTFIHYIAMTK